MVHKGQEDFLGGDQMIQGIGRLQAGIWVLREVLEAPLVDILLLLRLRLLEEVDQDTLRMVVDSMAEGHLEDMLPEVDLDRAFRKAEDPLCSEWDHNGDLEFKEWVEVHR